MSEQKIEEIFDEVKMILAYAAEAFLDAINVEVGHFETYGMDIMFDS